MESNLQNMNRNRTATETQKKSFYFLLIVYGIILLGGVILKLICGS